MAVINEVLAEKDQSAEANPTGTVTDVVIERTSSGQLYLQCKVVGGNWTNITNQRGAFSIATPDPTITYRFSSYGLSSSTRVYFGPA